MAADSRHKKSNQCLLDAIGKIRSQKQRASIERICATMRRQNADITTEEVSSQLDDAVRTGAIICVESKGAVSYRECSPCSSNHTGGRRRHLSDPVIRRPSPGTISEAVILAVREIGSGCSQDMVEQHVRKRCPDASGLSYADLHAVVTDACKHLVATRRFLSRDGLFYLKSDDHFTLLRASSTSLGTADGQLPSTTVNDSQVLQCNLVTSITARVARMYRFCLVCVCCVCLSGCQKLIILSLHLILHSPGGGVGPVQACPFVHLHCPSEPVCLSRAFCPLPSGGGLCDPALS